MSKNKKTKILFLEDFDEDLQLTMRVLKKEGIDYAYEATDNEKTFKKLLQEYKPNLILADFNLPTYSGMEALQLRQRLCPDTPFIFVTGTLGEENAVETLKQGASDFVLKTNLSRLPMAVKRALREVEEREQRQTAQLAVLEAEARYRDVFVYAPIGLCEVDNMGRIFFINQVGLKNLKNSKEEQLDGMKLSELLKGVRLTDLEVWLKEMPVRKAFYGVFSTRNSRQVEITLIPPKNGVGERKIIGAIKDITESVEMEEELRENNTTLETLIEAIPDLVYFKDNNRRYVKVNRAFVNASRLSLDKIINKTAADFSPESIAKESEYSDLKVLKTKEMVSQLEDLRREDGERIVYDTRKQPIFDKDNNVRGILGVSRDVTESIQAQEKMRRSEALLLEAESVAGMGSWEFQVEGESISCSLGAAKMMGISMVEKKIKYSDLIKSCLPADRNLVIAAFNGGIHDGKIFEVTHRLVDEQGAISWLQTKGRPHMNEGGDIIKIIGTFQDITEQRRNEIKLEKSRQLLKDTQALAKVGSFDWNLKQDILHCSEEFYNILSIDRAEAWLTIKNYYERVHPLDRELTRRKIDDVQAKMSTFDIEHRILLPDKTAKQIRLIGKFEKDKEGKPGRLLGTIQDITEKKEIEEAMLNGEEQERRRIAREIHDGIGQLLAATKFNLAALDGIPNEDKEIQIDKIHDTLELTIDEARRITKKLSTKVLEEFGLERAIQDLGKQASELTGTNFEMQYDLKDHIIGESVQVAIYRIVQESVNNMMKYSKATKLSIKLVAKEEYLTLTVKDNGKGFDINDPKYKMGNGLNNLRHRTKAIHGYIEIDSEIGKGTHTHINIPYETKMK